MDDPAPLRLGEAPTEPSTAYLRQLDEQREAALATERHPGSAG